MPIVNGMVQAAFSIGSLCGSAVFPAVTLEDYFLGASLISLLLPLLALTIMRLKDDHDSLKNAEAESTAIEEKREVEQDDAEITTKDLIRRPQTIPIAIVIGLMFGIGTSVMTNIQPICRAFGGIDVSHTTAIVLAGQLIGRCSMVGIHYSYTLFLKTNALWESVFPNLQMVVNLLGSLVFMIFSAYLSSLSSTPSPADMSG